MIYRLGLPSVGLSSAGSWVGDNNTLHDFFAGYWRQQDVP